MNFRAYFNTISTSCYTLPVVILYVTEGCNLRCITCSYRDPLPDELTLDELQSLSVNLKKFGLRHITYSGGEPLLRRDFKQICEIFSRLHIRQSLLTNGVLLEKRLDEIQQFLDEIIVSIDGPTPEVHNKIRGVNSFDLIVKGVRRAVESPKQKAVSIRTVVQKENFRHIPDMAVFARSLGVDRISFLAADVLSDSFGRDRNGSVVPNSAIMLNEEETAEFRSLVDEMTQGGQDPDQIHFLAGSAKRLYHIAQYFEAIAGKRSFPINRCNAPMVSAVITAKGDVLPCFFLPEYGNIRRDEITTLVNSPEIQSVRRHVRAYDYPRCQSCVCTLHKPGLSALFDSF